MIKSAGYPAVILNSFLSRSRIILSLNLDPQLNGRLPSVHTHNLSKTLAAHLLPHTTQILSVQEQFYYWYLAKHLASCALPAVSVQYLFNWLGPSRIVNLTPTYPQSNSSSSSSSSSSSIIIIIIIINQSLQSNSSSGTGILLASWNPSCLTSPFFCNIFHQTWSVQDRESHTNLPSIYHQQHRHHYHTFGTFGLIAVQQPTPGRRLETILARSPAISLNPTSSDQDCESHIDLSSIYHQHHNHYHH